ncbi:Ig-like domain-containing protein [Tahibacter amnicola]|uniref:Ig-like domain-containing protein n=1 Tax=Tahibacter amnicola TaxID=2976241 RepID=A0ABY6BIG9_9GAMM|nr:Ig-like domain-containing protein [Tahibacter amnicola]UXI69148.1 Ig-like domain-containing protein [Tahibacter amnicola]
MHRTLLALGIALALSAPSAAQENPAADARPVDHTIPLTYVGTNARVSLGVNDDGDIHGEGLGIFGFDGDSAWLGQLWLAEHGAGGVQFDYHWLWGGKTRQDTIDNPDSVAVAKAFVAVDQNIWNDRKATLGVGYEKNDFFVDGYLTAGITGKRFIGSTLTMDTTTLNGTENGHTYTQISTTRTITDAFEHPYEKGLGVRLGRYFDQPLLRLRGGLDYERGKFDSDQLTVSLGVDKYIRNTGWSLSLDGEYLKKSGEFEIDKRDTRGWLFARYEFGESFRAREPHKMVEVVHPAVQAVPPAPQVIRNEVKLDGDAFFDFDRSTLRPDAVAALDELLAKLSSNARVSRILIVGHTDSIGTDAYNQKLSERRAASAKQYLVNHGIPADQIDTRGDGERDPSFPNTTKELRQKNRRVDVEFLTVEETTVPVSVPSPKPTVEWKKEAVPAPAAWIERALRNPAQHKRTVDVYRFERETSTTTLGPKVFDNRPPDAVDDSATLPVNAPATAIAVLANDTDPDHDTLTVTAVSAAAHGTATFTAGGVSYQPTAGFTGTDTFTYTISDGFGGSDTATVTVRVGAGNRPPVAQNDQVSTPAGIPVNVSVLANDSDPDGDTVSVTSVGTPAHGTALKNADGSVTYTPVAGYTGTDTFTYAISDGNGGSATAQVTVTVGGAGNRPPVANPDRAQVLKGYGADINVLGNDTDPDGDRLRVIAVQHSGDFVVNLSINPDGTVRYQHTHGTQGYDYFTYTVTDDHGHEVTGTVEVLVQVIP